MIAEPATPARRERVVVAMSGGVDSAAAAALLCRDGYDAVGVLLRIWPSGRPAGVNERFDSCCSPRAADDARAVAAALGIPFYTLNYEAEFDREVIRPFCDAYAAGRTPVPCLSCNARLKFGSLLDRARGWGADVVATGHYARVGRQPRTGRFLLRRGADPRKDQSYFLYGLTQDQLARARFPVGGQTKAETRRLAAALGLPVADKPESQEICFVPRDYREVVRERVGGALRPGPIRHLDGRVLGSHAGLAVGVTIDFFQKIAEASNASAVTWNPAAPRTSLILSSLPDAMSMAAMWATCPGYWIAT